MDCEGNRRDGRLTAGTAGVLLIGGVPRGGNLVIS